MDFTLTNDQTAIKSMVQSFAKEKMEPFANKWDQEKTLPVDVLREAASLGLGGIYIPDTAQEKPQKGTVIAVGKGTKDNSMTVKIGDKILYGKYAGTELKYNGSDYMIMKESDILAIIK